MTPQEVYNRAKNGIINQGGFALNHRGYSMYLTENGLKCAAGHLFPDELHSDELEMKGIESIVNKIPHLREHLRLINDLQSAHDSSAYRTKGVWGDAGSNGYWLSFMTSVAEEHNLKP